MQAKRFAALLLAASCVGRVPEPGEEYIPTIKFDYTVLGYERYGHASLPAKVEKWCTAVGVTEERFAELFGLSGWTDEKLRDTIEIRATKSPNVVFYAEDPVLALSQRVNYLMDGKFPKEELHDAEDDVTAELLKRELAGLIKRGKIGGGAKLADLGSNGWYVRMGEPEANDECKDVPPFTFEEHLRLERDEVAFGQGAAPEPHPIEQDDYLTVEFMGATFGAGGGSDPTSVEDV